MQASTACVLALRSGGTRKAGRFALAVACAVVLCGCPGKVNLIKTITLNPGQTIGLNKTLTFTVSGLGTCREMTVDWGDDAPATHMTFVDLTAHSTVSHTYSGWPGGKTVTAQAVAGCEGKVNTRFKIEPAVFKVGWNRDPNRNVNTCVATPGRPALASMSLVHIVSPGSPVVNFGCPFGGCVYDADGKAGSTAAAPFPFPGDPAFSLPLRGGK